MKQYYGNYLGIVISGGEKDPEGRGRCQVFVPHIMPALYEGWNKEGQDLSFDIIGEGLPTSLNSGIVDKLKRLLPWAECAAPIVGASPSTKNGSEETRNTGGSIIAGLGPVVNLGGSPETNAKFAALTTEAAKNTFAVNKCGTAVGEILESVYGYSETQIRAGSSSGRRDGKEYTNILQSLNWTPKKISSPADAPPGSILTYNGISTNSTTAGQKYGHVEWVGVNPNGQKSYYYGLGGANGASNPGGGCLPGWTGVAWVPPTVVTDAALKRVGQSPINPSALTGDVGINMDQPEEEQNDYVNVDSSQLEGATVENGKVKPELLVKGAQGTRYGFPGDPFAISNDRVRGNANNPVHTGMVAISPELRQQYGLVNGDVIALKQEGKVTYGTVGNTTAANLPTTGGGPSGRRVDFLDLNGNMDYVNGSGDLYLISRAPDRTGPNGKGIEGQEATNYSVEQYNKTIALAQNNSIDFENATVANPELIAQASQSPSIHTTTSHPRNDGPDTNYQALGMFGYASEGTTVWVFFREGDPHFPVYFAASYGQKEWANMYGYASPGIGSGAGGAEPGTEKMRLNSYGGGFESAQVTGGTSSGLDPEFTFQVYGKNGSNLLFTKDHTEFNSTYNHNQRVSGDFHEITEANKETRVRGDKNTFVEQDVYETIGNWSDEAIAASDEIQQYINEAMEIKSKAGQSTA
jgi:hypothetical protein